ncbi:MAG TPA: ATP-binding protein [Rhizomicrobium sp.]|jgi:two-component system osmolarity sensor histidine kinase EnvZ|nr:ATP-binding protein [Rhizomicrobium sp.]
MRFRISHLTKRIFPRGLFGRSLIIVVAPMIVLQAFVTYAFFVRHYDIVTRHLAHNVAGDIAFLTDIERSYPPGPTRTKLLDMAAHNLGFQIAFVPGSKLGTPYRHSSNELKRAMDSVFANRLGAAHPFTSNAVGNVVDVSVQVKDGVLKVVVPRDQVVASNADIFILWMVGSSIVLIAVAVLFLRNQVKPIERLALAADAFGKGRAVPDFKPYGATEVRKAAQAFITMRARIDRYVQQRTEMLAGVSHDLKTPLTRLRLHIAMMAPDAETAAPLQDIAEMEHMLDEYMDFARGDSGEDAAPADLGEVVAEAALAAASARAATSDRLHVQTTPGIRLAVKRNALKRCATNLIDNALKHGDKVDVALARNGHFVEILVDDDGPGIPESRREEAFRPFHRLDQGRNLQSGGVGLGLAIARDIARAHGGDLTLGASRLGGLRAAIRLPV